MSATEQMRAMLDQLMGTDRTGDDSNKSQLHFSDPRVCKSFLLECCPNEILAATKMGLGDCSKLHDFALRADYKKAAREREYNYEFEAYEHLKQFVEEADRRTEKSKLRLANTQEELTTEAAEKLARVNELAELFGKKLALAEAAGSEGNVEESLRLMDEVDKIKKEKVAAELEYRNSIPTSSYQQQKLRVCEVCSALLGIQDNDRRLADHFGGKLHLGFIALRDKLDEISSVVEEKKKNNAERKEKERGSSRDRGDERRNRRRSRSRSPSGRNRGRERERDRQRYDKDRGGRRDYRQRDRYRERDRY